MIMTNSNDKNTSKKRNSNGQSIESNNNYNNTTIIPKYFDNSIPRSGKWSTEEETFANRLIIEFEAGSLMDCEDGCTLRSYLAKKLNCAPMRISKKFAGLCIGKHVFVKKIDSIITVDNGLTKLPELTETYKPSFKEPATVSIPAYTYPRFYNRNDFIESHGRESKAALIATLKKQINTAISGQPQTEEMSCNVGLDIDDMSDLANTSTSNMMMTSHNSFATNGESSDSSGGGGDEAEEWRDVLSFFCCDGLALTPEQIEIGMSLVRRDSSFIIKSNSYRVLLNAKTENC